MPELRLSNRHPTARVNVRALRRIALAALADPVFLAPPDAPPLPHRVFPRRSAAPTEVRKTAAPRRAVTTPATSILCYELAVFLVGARRMATLNERHLQHAGPTDVISFVYDPPPDAAPAETWLRGDLFICLDVARAQAREYGTSWPAELVRYLAHGFLHLRGFDDLAPAARRLMKRQEHRLLRKLSASFDFARVLAG